MEAEDTNPRQSTGKRLENNERWKILGYFECCQDQQKTAEYFGVNQWTVSRILSKFSVIGDVSDYHKAGREQIMNTYDESMIEETLEKNRYSTAQELAHSLEVGRNTILNKMQDLGYQFSVLKQIPLLNGSHIQKRYEHCSQLRNDYAKNIVFKDEPYFQLYRNTQGRWHFAEEGNFKQIPQTKVCLMVYGCICWEGKSELFIYEKGFKEDSATYCNVINKIFIPFAQKQFKKKRIRKTFSAWKLLQDNTPSHRSNATKKFLTENNIIPLNHPPKSPDLNPIELVWAILKRKVEKKQPQNEGSMRQYLIDSWESIDQQQIQACIQHFCSRILKVYDLQGKCY